MLSQLMTALLNSANIGALELSEILKFWQKPVGQCGECPLIINIVFEIVDMQVTI